MKRFLITAHIVFVLVGIATTMLGPLLPVLAQRWNLGDRQAGVLFLAQFIGGFCGAISSTRLARFLSLHWIARMGMLFTAAGFVGLAAQERWLATVGIAIYGIGIGLSTPAITAAVSEAAPEKRASILNLLNFAWALGAIAAPNLVLAALRLMHGRVGTMLVFCAAVILGAAFLMPKIAVTSRAEEPATHGISRTTLNLVVACGLLIFIYVGIENGIAGWLPTYATRVHSFGIERRALLQDTFWVTFLLGRFAAPVFLKVTGERLLLTFSIGMAGAGTAAVLLLHAHLYLFAAAAAMGLGCAAVFPTAIAVLTHRLSGQSGSTLGFVFASAGLGSAVLPYAIGSLSTAAQNLRTGMSLLLAAEAALLAAHFVMQHFAAQSDRVAIARGAAAAASS